MPEQVLRNAEEASVDKGRDNGSEGAVDEARSAEGKPYHSYDEYLERNSGKEDNFRNAVSGRKSKNGKTKKRKSGGLKKKGPLIAIVTLLALLAGLLVLAQSVMPFAIVNRMIEEFNTAGFSSILRSDNILNYQMSAGNSSFAMTDYQKKSLENNKILPIDIGGGTVLAYETNESGVWKVVHGDVPASPDISQIKILLKSKYSSRNYTALALVTIDEAMKDGAFKNPYTTASKTWRGGNSGWYDTLSSLNEQIRGYQRSRFWYTNTNKLSKALASSAKVQGYRKSVSTRLWNSITKRRTLNQYIGDTMAGTKIGKALGLGTVNQNMTKTTAMTKLGLSTAALLANVSSAIAGLGCQGLQMISKAQTLIGSIQNLQYLNLASGVLESIQSTQIGHSDGEPMREYMEALTLKDESGGNGISADGMSALLTGSEIDESSESVQRVSAENAMSNIDTSTSSGSIIIDVLRGAATSVTDILSAINTCNKVAAGLSVLSTVASIAVTVASFGAGAIASTIITSIISAAVSLAGNALAEKFAGAVFDWVWEKFGSTIAQNVATDWLGPDFGNALYQAGNYYIQSQHQIGSGAFASKKNVIGYRREQNRLIAEEAEYQRSIRSPFDASSQYTFLGSIVYSLIPIAATSSIGDVLKNISTIMTNSISKISPTASAIEETQIAVNFGSCPTLESIGGSCDKMGRAYYISDNYTLENYTPKEIVEKVYQLGGIKSTTPNADGTYEVVEDSNAERMLTFCYERLSDPGRADANVSEILVDREHSKQWWRKIPILGDIIGALYDIFKDDNQDVRWIVGKSCGYTEENSCFWEEEGKYYQAFFQDQRLLENNGSIKKSSATVALERYHEQYPIDNSTEGILARYSGMTKDDVIATIDFLNAMEYIANYHPEERIAFGIEEKDDTIYFEETTDDFAKLIAVEPKYIVYDTLRNKATIG